MEENIVSSVKTTEAADGARLEQIAPEKIVVSGVNKTYESMKRILSYSKGAGIYTIESEEHAKILRTLAEKNQMPLLNYLTG